MAALGILSDVKRNRWLTTIPFHVFSCFWTARLFRSSEQFFIFVSYENDSTFGVKVKQVFHELLGFLIVVKK